MNEFPQILHTVLDTTEVRELAEFYRQLLGLQYRPGDEPATEGTPDDLEWLVLTDTQGDPKLDFQQVEHLKRTTWPSPDVPMQMQMHLDLTVPDRETLEHHHSKALTLGAELRFDHTDDPNEPLNVYADPAGHPFCIFVG